MKARRGLDGPGDSGRWRETGERRRNAHLEDDLQELVETVEPFSIQIDPPAQDRILMFARELIAWNERFNLLSRADAPNVIRKHVAASLGVFLVIPPTEWDRWIDVGTGAGFPGLVLKMVQPSLDMTLVDSARKRCLFIENTVRSMDLGRVPVLAQRVETLLARGEAVGRFTVLTARAVAALNETLISFGPLVAIGGRVVTFKGPQWKEELDEAGTKGVLDQAGFTLESSTRIPWTAGHLLSFRKVRLEKREPRIRAMENASALTGTTDAGTAMETVSQPSSSSDPVESAFGSAEPESRAEARSDPEN